MRKLACLLALGLLALAPLAQAASTDTQWVGRDWEHPSHAMRTRLYLSAPGGGSIWVYVDLYLTDEAPLHIGEAEEWRVRGRLVGEGPEAGSSRVDITVEPSRYYHAYPGYSWRSVTVWGSGSASAAFYLGHDGRIQDGAAPAVKNTKVDYTTLDEPFKIGFEDIAYEANGSVPTSYRFSVRRRSLWSEGKLVARGEFDHVDAPRQEVVVEQGGAFTGDADEWFKQGKDYVVRIQFRRQGSPWYTDDWGDTFAGVFTWDSQSQTLERVPALEADPREGQRERSFEALHP